MESLLWQQLPSPQHLSTDCIHPFSVMAKIIILPTKIIFSFLSFL